MEIREPVEDVTVPALPTESGEPIIFGLLYFIGGFVLVLFLVYVYVK